MNLKSDLYGYCINVCTQKQITSDKEIYLINNSSTLIGVKYEKS